MMKPQFFPPLSRAVVAISRSFGIPKNTLLTWKKHHGTGDNYRGYLYDKLAVITQMEQGIEKKIKAIFTRQELMALWGSLNGTMYNMQLIEDPSALSYGFRDYCHYDRMESQQFTEGELSLFSEHVSEKLDALSMFERYVLLVFIKTQPEYIFGKEEKDAH